MAEPVIIEDTGNNVIYFDSNFATNIFLDETTVSDINSQMQEARLSFDSMATATARFEEEYEKDSFAKSLSAWCSDMKTLQTKLSAK